MAEKKEVAVIPYSNFAVVKSDPSVMKEIMAENIGEGGITPFDLDRIKVPSGGGLTWEIPNIDGEILETKMVDGIIVYWKEPRAYWATQFEDSGGGTPPDCSAFDGVTGMGEPGGECAKCPLAAFGTAEKGGGQAFKQTRMMFLLRPDSLLPTVLAAPPTSLKPIRAYFLRLAGQAVPFYTVISRFTLEKAKSGTGIEYSRIVPSVGARLSAEEVAQVKKYAEGFRATFETMDLAREDFADETPE